jgi:hypothetical protein
MFRKYQQKQFFKNDFSRKLLKYTKQIKPFGFISTNQQLLFYLFINLWLQLYIKSGIYYKNLLLFLECFSILKFKLKINFFFFMQQFFFKYALSIITTTIRKSAKLYIIPWYVRLNKLYKAFFRLLYSQIVMRSEKTLKLRFISICSTLISPNNTFNLFLIARKNLCTILLENKHNLYLSRNY